VNLDGALIAVTGGARGIGLATAQALTRRGAAVHIGDLDGKLARAEAHRLGLRSGYDLNVADRVSFAAFLEAIRAADGPLDGLVNNAGVMPFGPFLDEHEDVTAQTVGVNLVGVVNGMRLALPSMVERGHGHVLNVASLAARVPVPGSAVYSGTKAAVVALTDSVRRELRGTGVNLTTVLPTMVSTELASGVPGGRGLMAIDPEDAAMTIIRALERPGGTVVAGRPWLDLVSRLMVVAPRSVDRLVRALLKDDRLLVGYDVAARAGYDARLAAARQHEGDDCVTRPVSARSTQGS
jgi:NADP-dependent 3-hydroxy acid dehydrogenase YdfG